MQNHLPLEVTRNTARSFRNPSFISIVFGISWCRKHAIKNVSPRNVNYFSKPQACHIKQRYWFVLFDFVS